MDLPRAMWTLFEPVHAVTYFAPAARAAFEAVGLRGYWRGYFGGRAAPLGPVGAAPVVASFFSFAPGMVSRALPDVWSRADPATALDARRAGAHAALTDLLAGADVAEAADLLREAAAEVPTTGRPLAAANAALPWPDDPLDVLWQAATVLREHRGDGHVAGLLVAGLDGVETCVWRASLDTSKDALQPARGWTDDEWAAAGSRLRDRGWLGADGTATAAGRAVRDEVEATTDRLAAEPWERLGPARTDRLRGLLRPLAVRAYDALPATTPIGLPAPV
jgi:hypothetical protein